MYFRLDKNDLSKKKKACSISKNPAIYITEDYCDQQMILMSKNQLVQEDHLRENNDRVSYVLLILFKTINHLFIKIESV